MKTEQSQTKQQYCVSKWKARKRKPHDSLCLSLPPTTPGCHLCFPTDICFILPSLPISFLCCFMPRAAYKPHSSNLGVVTETNQGVTCPLVLHSEHIMKWHFSASFAVQFSSVQSFSRVWLFETPWTAAHQASLSITNSRSLLKLTSIESVMPSNNLILHRPILFLPSIFPSIRAFSNEWALCIRWPEYGTSASVLPVNIQCWFPLGLTGLIS